jgi:predicted dehydrogenase
MDSLDCVTGTQQRGRALAVQRIGIIVNGATGGLATGQHLRGLLQIRKDGGLPLRNGVRLMPDPVLVGRNAGKLAQLCWSTGLERWTTDLDTALASRSETLFFDAGVTGQRVEAVSKAIAAGKHVYCEKPIAGSLEQALAIVREAEAAGIKHGTVQDKLFLPGFRKLALLKASNYFGRVLEVRLEFGRWIFDGTTQETQRPSWNYRKADGGGLILDMFPHWRYMIDHLVAPIRAVSATSRIQIRRRVNEEGHAYDVDVEDAVFAQLELEGGIIASVNSSWATRIRRDDVITLQIDGIRGSALAGPHDCWVQPDVSTPKPVLSVDARQPHSFFEHWLKMPDNPVTTNSYRSGWELFLRHVAEDGPFPSPLIEGAKGVQFAELAYQSHRERRWIDVPALI